MSQKFNTAIAVIGIDIGKNSFHVVGHDERGAIMLRQKCPPTPTECYRSRRSHNHDANVGATNVIRGPVNESRYFDIN